MRIITLFLLVLVVGPLHAEDTQAESASLIHRPHLSIIIDDIGDRFKDGRAIVELPASLTVGIIPYTPFANRLAKLADQHNKEILLHLPMETVNGKYLGKAGLHSGMDESELLKSLYQSLNSIKNVRGVSNHMGSQLTQDSKVMSWLMNGLQLYGGLYFVDSRTINTSMAHSVAQDVGLAHAQRDVFLDHNPEKIQQQWNYMLKLVRRQGSAVAIGHPYPETIRFLKEALPQLESQGINLVSVSELIRWRQSRGKLAWQAKGSSSH